MRTLVQLLGIIIGLVGLGLVFYSETYYIPYVGSITVYPYRIVGAIVLLIGFVTFFIGVAIPEEKGITALEEPEEESGQVELTKFTGEIKSKGMTCETCLYFGNPIMCPFKERNARAKYCVHYKSKNTRI